MSVVFFFFQAEDGIRDIGVTGVQTCALPIYIWVMNSDGTGQRQLTVGARSNYGPSVSADGRYIYFVSNRAGGPFHIWRMDADGSNPKQLTSQRGENFPHATPDGRFVVYATIGFGREAAVWK